MFDKPEGQKDWGVEVTCTGGTFHTSSGQIYMLKRYRQPGADRGDAVKGQVEIYTPEACREKQIGIYTANDSGRLSFVDIVRWGDQVEKGFVISDKALADVLENKHNRLTPDRITRLKELLKV